jgi:hypothetical protein
MLPATICWSGAPRRDMPTAKVSGVYAPPCFDASMSSSCWTAVLMVMYLHVRQWVEVWHEQ